MSIAAKKRAVAPAPAAQVTGFALVRTGRSSHKPVVEPGDRAQVLVAKAARALRKPGIDKGAVFSGRVGVHAYSVNPADVTQVIEESADGTRRIGRLVNGRFMQVKPARKAA